MNILDLVKRRHSHEQGPKWSDPVTSAPAPHPSVVLNMSLRDFAQAGLLVRVKCRTLADEEVYFASSQKEAEIGRAEGLQVYTSDELAELFRLQPDQETLKTIHEAKLALGARVMKHEP